MPLILEKITTPAQLPSISRQRLLSMLQNNLESCVSTVISGRAGAGKTTLAVDFARICSRPVAWYKVDAADVELSIFFEYLIACIRRHIPKFDDSAVLSQLAAEKTDDISLLAENLVYELLEIADNSLLIVIEDLHLICDAKWLVPFLQRFLPLLPRDIHILITSRTLPPAPLWRMRSKQTLKVIEEATLAFTREEAVELFKLYGLPDWTARLAFEQTQGRVAALAARVTGLGESEMVRTNLSTKTVDPSPKDFAETGGYWS
jgi:LuxR family maltose regulon positive regulatory protein